MDNILSEPTLIKDYHTEYLKLIREYSNVSRNTVFVKYYNINTLESVNEEQLNSTFDNYTYSNIKFDIYDITPAYMLQPIQNRSTDVTDLKGQMLDGLSSIVLYSLARPKIHDLLTFYNPVQSNEIFRVTSITVPVNAIHSTVPVNFYQLDLEYAPVKQLESLLINQRFVYDLAKEQYIEFNEYKKQLKLNDDINILLEKLNKYYDSSLDLYHIEGKVFNELNDLLICFKSNYNKNYNRLYDNIKRPYGYSDLFPDRLVSLNTLTFNDLILDNYQYYDLSSKQNNTYLWRDKLKFENNIEELLFISLSLWQLLTLEFHT